VSERVKRRRGWRGRGGVDGENKRENEVTMINYNHCTYRKTLEWATSLGGEREQKGNQGNGKELAGNGCLWVVVDDGE